MVAVGVVILAAGSRRADPRAGGQPRRRRRRGGRGRPGRRPGLIDQLTGLRERQRLAVDRGRVGDLQARVDVELEPRRERRGVCGRSRRRSSVSTTAKPPWPSILPRKAWKCSGCDGDHLLEHLERPLGRLLGEVGEVLPGDDVLHAALLPVRVWKQSTLDLWTRERMTCLGHVGVWSRSRRGRVVRCAGALRLLRCRVRPHRHALAVPPLPHEGQLLRRRAARRLRDHARPGDRAQSRRP